MPSTPNFVESGIPFITSKNIKNGRIDFDDVSYISENDYLDISKNRKITKKDILITMIGTIGELAIVKEQKDFYGQNLFLVRIDNKIVLDEFFRHLFMSSSTQNKLRNSQQNSNQGYLRKSNILDLNFDIPSLKTQEKIVQVLDNFETICKDLNIGLPAEEVKRQEQYQYYRDAIFKYLETGIIDNKGIGERERESGLIRILSFIFERINLAIKHFTLMKYGTGNSIPSSEQKLFPVYGAKGIVSYYDQYNNEDSAIVGHIGSVGDVVWASGKHFVTYNGTIVNGIKGISNSKFIYHLLCTLDLKKYKKGSQPFLSISDFENLKVSLPSLKTQEKIVKVLDNFEAICKDLHIGLPAEEVKRQRQYEHYRDAIFNYIENKAK